MAETMWTLNDVAGQAMVEYGARRNGYYRLWAPGDAAWEMAKGSKVHVRLYATRVPMFEEALVFAKRGYLTQGDVSNR